jgi:hypothetical protein
MGLSGKLLQIIALPGVIIIFAIVAAAAATTATIARPGCNSTCGNVEIPFPFGLSEECYLDESFRITCHSGKPTIGNAPVTRISIGTHELNVRQQIAQDCYKPIHNVVSSLNVGTQFTISNKKNIFTVLGCDTSADVVGYLNTDAYSTGCSSECPSLSNVVNGSCSGVGCCEVGFPDDLRNIRVQVKSFRNHSKVWNFNPCGYAFVVEKGEFNFSASYLNNYPNQTVPLVLDWGIGNHGCEKVQNEQNYACQENSECTNHRRSKQGYHCECKQGYQGNPYLHGHGGCQGIIIFPIEKVRD